MLTLVTAINPVLANTIISNQNELEKSQVSDLEFKEKNSDLSSNYSLNKTQEILEKDAEQAQISESELRENASDISLNLENKTQEILEKDAEQSQISESELRENASDISLNLENKTQEILEKTTEQLPISESELKENASNNSLNLENKTQEILEKTTENIPETTLDSSSLLLVQEQPSETNSTPNPEQPSETNSPPTSTTPEPRVLVAEVLITGVENELKDLVYKEITTKPGRTTTRTLLQEDVNSIYATGFFSNVKVTPEDTPLGVRITFAVVANPVLKQVVVETVPEGDKKQVLPPEVIENIFSKNYGQILNLQELQEDIKVLNTWYKDNGYDLAQVVGVPQLSEDGIVTLIVAEGLIENIKVRYFDEENAETTKIKTREFIITREVELKAGDIFNRNTAQKDLQRVFGLGLFKDVKLSFSPGEDPSKVVVNVDVVEGQTGSIAAGAGISSANGLFGTVSYQQQNFGGNNQTIATELQIDNRTFLFDLSFTDPWIGGDPYRTSYTVNAFRRRSVSLIFDGGDPEVNLPNGDSPRIVRTGGGVNFSRPIAENVFSPPKWRLATGFQYQHVEATDDEGDISPQDELGNNIAFSDSGQDDLFTLQFTASQDRRNNTQTPTAGSIVRLGIDQTIPLGSGNILFSRLRASYNYYIPISLINFSDGPQTIALSVQGGTVIGDLPPYEAFSIGGMNSVRGYDEGEVGSGRSYAQATAEYRFPIFSIVGGVLFLDYGTDLGTGSSVPGDPAGVRGKPGSGFGYGIGVRVKSPIGPIRVDWGFNDQGDNRIQFGVGERF